MRYDAHKEKQKYDEKITNATIALVDKTTDCLISEKCNFKSVYKKFWKSYLSNQSNEIFPNEILDTFFSKQAIGLVIKNCFKEIDKSLEVFNQKSKNIKLEDISDEKTIVKLLIKTETTIFKYFWEEVISKIKDEAHTLAMTAKDKKLPVDHAKLNSKLWVLENGFLNILAELYLKNKESSKHSHVRHSK